MDFKKKYGPWGIVIGASMGIGACCARELAERGLNVVVCARSRDKLEKVAADIAADYGVMTKVIALDWTSDEREAVLDQELKDIDLGCAIYSAAWGYQGAFLKGSLEEYRRINSLNVDGALFFSMYFGKLFCEKKHGGMLFLGSGAGYTGTPYMSAYAGSKGFEAMLAISLYTEFKPCNVDVTVAYIGAVDTPGLRGLFPDEASFRAQNPETPESTAKESIDGLGFGATVFVGNMMKQAYMGTKALELNQYVDISGQAAIDMNYAGKAPEQF
ncbi:MAG: SDR family NAD(P)-dependent oxidoreductase [Eubacteriales bacterium]|nr:SDR family NAD(P)-dependent oxidoreductase [Eubacteriales bacterium]